MNFILKFFQGLLIGIGAITPGVSGGSLAVIFGLYERITDLIANVFKDFKKNFKNNLIFFLPIGLGGVVGVLGFSKVMEYLFANYSVQVKFLFIGLILGTLPLVFKQANKNGFKKIYILPFVISLIVTIFLTLLDNSVINAAYSGNQNFIMLMIYGAILGFGTIIPGISASFILMYLGAYETIISSIGNINIPVLFPVGIGFILSIIIFAKFINLLFRKVYGYTYYTILGFVLGSIVPIFPAFERSINYYISFLLLPLGFILSFYLSKIKKED